MSEPILLVCLTAAIIVVSVLLSPRKVSVEGFFSGMNGAGQEPTLWTLVLSQVTTWIFARSLLTAAILGYYYGVAGALAYTAYYLSFVTGGYIVAALRGRGATSFQDYLRDEFASIGPLLYNIVIALRLMSEVFANLLVVGLIFTAAFGDSAFAGQVAMVLMALTALGYSAMGGLRASLRTDVFQMGFFVVVFVLAFLAMVFSDGFSFGAVLSAEGISGGYNGWVLLVVAFLQVISYPAHDPVMMDRGFLASPEVTRKSFFHAFWISALCIFGFALFGVQASVMGAELTGGLLGTWKEMFGQTVWFLIAASLLVSAMSTLDSALASSARLAIEELGLGARTIANGRIAMAVFMLGGVLFLLGDTKTLFDAVAVSGTASMFLAPVIVLGLWMNCRIPLWAYVIAFGAAVLGAVAYFFQSDPLVISLFGEGHKYERLLAICVVVHLIGFGAGILGVMMKPRLAG